MALRAVQLVMMLAVSAISLQAQTAAPRPGAGYVLPDGAVQVVAQRDLVPLIEQLNELYAQSHPGVKFKVRGGDNYSGMAALSFDTSAFAPLTSEFTRIGLGDNLKISPEPTPVRIAHASLKATTLLSPLAVIVNQENPLVQLTMDQLTRIFVVGGPVGDISQWSQLGVTGRLAERAISPCGPPSGDYFAFDDPQVGEFLGLRKFNGLTFTHTYTPLPHYKDIVQRVAEDPAAIGIAALNTLTPGVRVVGLATARGGPAYSGTPEDIAADRYPLDRAVYIYLRANPGLDPFARDYARMVLSPEGQRIIAASSAGYIPLSARDAAAELASLER